MELFKPYTLNIKGELYEVNAPKIMGILNITPDSFYDRQTSRKEIQHRVHEIIAEGVDIIDIGGCSTRPGYQAPSAEEEMDRVALGIGIVKSISSDVLISIDTFRGSVAREAINMGADIINDVSAMTIDEEMFDAVKELNVPYILTHPSHSCLSTDTPLDQTTPTVLKELSAWIHKLSLAGVADVIVDPGFGFGKTMDQNYELMHSLNEFKLLNRPLLVGISRKSMVYNLCDCRPNEALPGTIALNSMALYLGASILRVHDVAAAAQTIKVINKIFSPQNI